MRQLRYVSGDTIIEVLLAVTIFSLVAVGALTVMNRGMNTAQQSLEITQVKQQIDSQAAALRAAHQAHIGSPSDSDTWSKIINHIGPTGSTGTAATTTTCPSLPRSVFIMNPRSGDLSTVAPSAMDGSALYPYPGVWYADADQIAVSQTKGIWIEAQRKDVPGGAFPAARDFIIKACWNVPGSSIPQTLDTLVRLYEP